MPVEQKIAFDAVSTIPADVIPVTTSPSAKNKDVYLVFTGEGFSKRSSMKVPFSGHWIFLSIRC